MKQPPPEPSRCEACRRPKWRGPAMTETSIPDVGRTFLCNDAADCRLYWPVEPPLPGAA